MYKLVKIDLLDAFIYADIFDDQAYTLIKESENLEEILELAIEGFKIINPSFKNYLLERYEKLIKELESK